MSIVETSLLEQLAPGFTATQLYRRYENFGDDPFIVTSGDDKNSVKFSAWLYAKQRCAELLENSADDTQSK
jgi:hypothetical protein